MKKKIILLGILILLLSSICACQKPTDSDANIDLTEPEIVNMFFGFKRVRNTPYILLKDNCPVAFHYNSVELIKSLTFKKVYEDYNSTYYSGDYQRNEDVNFIKGLAADKNSYYLNYYNDSKLVSQAKQAVVNVKEPYMDFDFNSNLIAYTTRDDFYLHVIKDNVNKQITKEPVRDIRVFDEKIFFIDDNNQLNIYDNGKITIHDGVSRNYQVLNDTLFYIDNNNLVKYNIDSKEKCILEKGVRRIITDEHYLYYLKNHTTSYNDYFNDEIYRYNNDLTTPEFVTVAGFKKINTFFAHNNKVYVGCMENYIITNIRCITPNKEIFGKDVLYENDKHIVFYVDYVSYENEYGEVFVYDKQEHKIVHRFYESMTKNVEVLGNDIYFGSSRGEVYRFNLKTLKNELIYERKGFASETTLYYAIMNDNM